jgi:hypothetical protein
MHRQTAADLSYLPLSRATVQLWGIEQAGHRAGWERGLRQRVRRRPVRAIVRWISTAPRH